MDSHEVKIEVSDAVWIEAEFRAKEEKTDALNVIINFIEQSLEAEFGDLIPLPKIDIDKEDDTPV